MPSSSSRFTQQDIEYLREQILGEPFSFPTAMGSYITNTVATNPPTLHLDDIYDGRPEYGTTLPNNPYNGYEYYHVLDSVNNVIAFKRYNASDAAWEIIGGPGEIPRVTSLPGSPATGELVFHLVDATNTVVQLKRYSGSVWEVISEGLPPRVTTLPTSPTDGQVCYDEVDTTNDTFFIKRYYTSGAAWEVMGFTPPAKAATLPTGPESGQQFVHTSNTTRWLKRYSGSAWEVVGVGAPPTVRVYNSAAITLTTGTIWTLTFDSERFDTDTMHSTSVNTGRLTATTAGVYHIYGMISFEDDAASVGRRLALIRLNGTTVIAQDSRMAVTSSGGTTDITISTLYKLAANDYVELRAYHEQGVNLDVIVSGNFSPEFGMTYVGEG